MFCLSQHHGFFFVFCFFTRFCAAHVMFYSRTIQPSYDSEIVIPSNSYGAMFVPLTCLKPSLFFQQFFERLKIIFMPVKHQPDLMYLRQVPLKRIHIFTFIQLFCLAVLWAIKSTAAALIFPIMVCTVLV